MRQVPEEVAALIAGNPVLLLVVLLLGQFGFTMEDFVLKNGEAKSLNG